jgi:hypothetical protein
MSQVPSSSPRRLASRCGNVRVVLEAEPGGEAGDAVAAVAEVVR